MRWDVVLAVAVACAGALGAWVWWTFVRIPSYLRGVSARVPLGVSWRQFADGTFMMHHGTAARLAHVPAGAPLSLQWAFGWILHVHDVDLALQVVRYSPALWQQIPLPAAPWSLVRQLWGNGLFVSNNPHWRRHRAIAAQAFTVDALRHSHALAFLPTAKQLADDWHQLMARDDTDPNGAPTCTVSDVTDVLGRYSLLSLGRALFGYAFDEREARHVVDSVTRNVFQPSRYVPGSLYDLLPTATNAAGKDALSRLNALIYAVVTARRAFHEERASKQAARERAAALGVHIPATAAGEEDRPILMDHLLLSTDEQGVRLTDAEVRDETLGFLLAGLDSSQLSLSALLWLLAHNPRAQQRCYDELVRVCGEQHVNDLHWCGPTADDVAAAHMPYAQACVHEALRLFRLNQPVRACNAPATVGPVALPAGTIVIVDAWSLHRSEKYWRSDADLFRPERWLDEDDDASAASADAAAKHAPNSSGRANARANGHANGHSGEANGHGNGHGNGRANGHGNANGNGHANGHGEAVPKFRAQTQAFFAFGGSGPRACPGRSFAVGWQRVVLSLLLARFVLSPAPDPSATQRPDDGGSGDLKWTSKGPFNAPDVRLVLTPRPAFARTLVFAR